MGVVAHFVPDDAAQSVFAFVRRARNGDAVLVVCNLTPVPRQNYFVGVPAAWNVVALCVYIIQPDAWVTLLTGEEGYRFSARNQLSGEVFTLVKGAVSTEVGLRLSGGNEVFAVVTNEAAASLGLREGGAATALIKASHIILGVED